MPSADRPAAGGPVRCTVRCTVLSRLGWDGAFHEPGAIVALPPDVAESLEAIGTVAPAGDPNAAGDEIADAIRALDPDDKALWNKDGKPAVDAIEAALGRDIAAAQRDEAWAVVAAGREGAS